LRVFAVVDFRPILLNVQRLFSTFPNSFPGAGLLILRLAAGFSLLGVDYMASGLGDVATVLLRCVAIAAAVLLLLGFGTPFAAVGEAMIQVGITTLEGRYNSSAVIATALGVALAMLGPGAWSLDARVFGRKRIV
jgi:putative oxidoreductase